MESSMERYPGYLLTKWIRSTLATARQQRRSGAVVPPLLLCSPSCAAVLSSQGLGYALLATIFLVWTLRFLAALLFPMAVAPGRQSLSLS
eukprot:5068504-Pleurochrysis_carterae.AAC.1